MSSTVLSALCALLHLITHTQKKKKTLKSAPLLFSFYRRENQLKMKLVKITQVGSDRVHELVEMPKKSSLRDPGTLDSLTIL